MLQYFLVTWWILAYADLGLTYYTIKSYKKLYPTADHTQFERNPLPRFFIQKFGLPIGISLFTIIMVIIIFGAVYGLYLLVTLPYFIFSFGFITGFYFFLIIFVHLSNARSYWKISKLLKKPETKKDAEKFIDLTQKRFEVIEKLRATRR